MVLSKYECKYECSCISKNVNEIVERKPISLYQHSLLVLRCAMCKTVSVEVVQKLCIVQQIYVSIELGNTYRSQSDKTLVSCVTKQNKGDLLLSTMHDSAVTDLDSGKLELS